MSMLARYRKKGGFEQLLLLIEGCAKKKQDQLLTLIEKEDQAWFEKLKLKILTPERVLSFGPSGLSEIFSRIPEKVLVYALHGIPTEKHELCLGTFTHFKRKSITELLAGSKPRPDEIEAAFMQIYKKIREMDKERLISIAKLLPTLAIEEKDAA